MANAAKKYYLVESGILPEILLKVTEAQELLQTGAAATVADAVAAVGISRSAFYKYKDGITPFQDLKRGHILTFHVLLLDRPGSLSAVLAVFAACGSNILTINQSIPTNGCANITVSAETGSMTVGTEEMLQRFRETEGVLRAEILAG